MMFPAEKNLTERPEQDPSVIRSMFDRISPTYDRLNRTLAFGIDRRWRRRAVAELGNLAGTEALDLCCGTCDMTIEIMAQSAGRFRSITAVDFSDEMLKCAAHKLAGLSGHERVQLLSASAEKLPCAEQSFDCACVAFGVRNVRNVPNALREAHRVLRSGGRFVILEFSMPTNPFIRIPYSFYFRHILPRIGGLVSGDKSAYHYLNRSTEQFPSGEAFAEIVRHAGFSSCAIVPLSYGVATLYIADK